jgi:hypothetical protein
MNTRLSGGVLAASACAALCGCVTFAPPSPLLTLGGPKTTAKGTSELAMAAGMAGARFPDAHGGGQGAFARYKRGVTDSLDLGADAAWASYSGKQVFTAKGVMRYQLAPQWRLELGTGFADSSDGKSLNGDVGVTWGTIRSDRTWNCYATLRGGGARGYAGDAIFGSGSNDDDEPEVAPPNTFFGMVSLGAQAQVSAHQRWIIEGGAGFADPQHHDDSALLLYVAVGLLLDVGDER